MRLRVEQKVDADVRDERKIEDEKVRRGEEWKGQITRMIIEGFGVWSGEVWI